MSEGAAAYRVERGTRASRYGALIAVAGLAVLIRSPSGAGARTCAPSSRSPTTWRWRSSGTARGLCRAGLGGAAGLPRARRLRPLRLAMNAGVHPIAAIPLAGIAAALFAVPTAFIVFRLRGAYFAIGTWVGAESTCSPAPRSRRSARLRHEPAAAVVRGIAQGRMWRESAIYWTGLAIAVGAIALVSCCCARATGSRSPRSGIRRPPRAASASTTSAPRSGSTSSPPSAPAWWARWSSSPSSASRRGRFTSSTGPPTSSSSS